MRGLIPPASVEDLELVASELVTNAFLHGVAPVQYHTEPGRTEVTCRLVTRDSQGA